MARSDSTSTGPQRSKLGESGDLGLGSVLTERSQRRFLNRDGTFNVRRRGMRAVRSAFPYHTLLTLSWPRFLAAALGVFLLANALFAVGYILCGPDALPGAAQIGVASTFGRAFVFSVHTFATIGYGHVIPFGRAANTLVTIEALLGLLMMGVAAGVTLARLTRPTAAIAFSERAIVSPFQAGTGFMFRIVNARSNQLLDVTARLTLVRWNSDRSDREFFSLPLEYDKVPFFPLTWTIVHPINEESPLWGVEQRELEESEAEFLVMLTAFDETFSQTVHARSSYRAHEVEWGVRFASLYESDEDRITIDVERLSDLEPVAKNQAL